MRTAGCPGVRLRISFEEAERVHARLTVTDPADEEGADAPVSLFVGNLPVAATEAELLGVFTPFGATTARVVMHRGSQRATPRSRGFGYVNFTGCASANAALEATHELHGQSLALQRAKAYDDAWVRPVRIRRRVREFSPGVVWIEKFFDDDEQIALADLALALGHDGDAPGFYTPSYAADGESGASAHELKIQMFTLGRHWNCRRGCYEPTRSDFDNREVAPVPDLFRDAVRRVLDAVAERVGPSAFPALRPDVCIVNYYHGPQNSLGLHQDKHESAESIGAGKPVVSFSFGDTAVFEYVEADVLQLAEAAGRAGSLAQIAELPRQRVRLNHGDVLVFGGPSRSIYHAVGHVMPHTNRVKPCWNSRGMKRGRLNLTFRESV